MRSENEVSKRTNYIIYGSDAALQLYEESPAALMAAENCDFDVVRCTPNNPITSVLDDFVPYERFLFINEETYTILHKNLSEKASKILGYSFEAISNSK